MNKQTTAVVKDLLAAPKKIIVVGHKNPDGDAVGSCLALSLALKSMGHSSKVMMPNDFPDFLKWLPGCEDILVYEKDSEANDKLIEAAELIFTLDFNALNRVGDMETPLKLSLIHISEPTRPY